MTTKLKYREFDSPRDLGRVAFLISQAFGVEEEGCRKWIEEARSKQVRVVDRAGSSATDACLFLIPMGQFFGGRSVSMMGIAGVAVAPEARGSGIATHLMAESLRETRARGIAISTLFPATQPVYRKVGYEQSGALWQYSLDPSRLRGVKESQLDIVPLTKADQSRINERYKQFACLRDGYLDRNDYIWDRVFVPRGNVASGWAFVDGDTIEGCVFTVRKSDEAGGKRVLPISDLWMNSPRAARRIIGFLADHASVVREIVFHGPNPHPLLLAMQEQAATTRVKDYWMTRIVDVAGALEQRGYPAGMTTSVLLEVIDDLLTENSGLYRLSVDDGAARVERISQGGQAAREGRVRVDIRDLAPIYCGFMTPHTLAATTGRVEGDERGLTALAGLFAGGMPCLTDPF